MTLFTYPIEKPERVQLEADIAVFLKNGGKIEIIEPNEIKYTRQQVVRRGLFNANHLTLISRETDIPIVTLRRVRRHLHGQSDALINQLYEYFIERQKTRI